MPGLHSLAKQTDMELKCLECEAKWVPYNQVNQHLYEGWQLVTGYKPCHHDKYGILMIFTNPCAPERE